MSMSIFDVNANTLEAAWYLDTPAGPIPQAGGNVSLDRSWTPVLQATTEYNTDHELADQIEPLSPDPLVLRLRTQTAGLPILDTGTDQRIIWSSSFEQGLDGYQRGNTGTVIEHVPRGTAFAGIDGLGEHCLAFSRPDGNANGYIMPSSSTRPAVTPGRWLATSVWVDANEEELRAYYPLQFLTASGTLTSSGEGASASPTYVHGGMQLVSYARVPDDAATVRGIVWSSSTNVLTESSRFFVDGITYAEADTQEQALAAVQQFSPSKLGEYEWPAPDIVGARVNQATYWVYPRSTREDVVNRRTSVELASADLLMAEVRNGSGEPWIAAPSTDDSYGRTDYVMTRALSQAIVHAGLPITVLADDAETSPLDEPTWAVADNLTSFMQALLHSRYEWQFNPRLNQYQLRYQPPQPAEYSLGSAGRRLQSAVITRGDSTELGTLDYADGLIVYWRWTSRYDGSTHERVETILAEHITDWRQVTKWAELTINSSPQTYGQYLLGNRTDRGAQALITAALDGWSVDDLGLKWSDAASSYQTLSFSVDGGTYTINGPLREG